MRHIAPLLLLTFSTLSFAAEPVGPAKPVLKITPGKVIIPFDAMRRPWGELISIDLATRTGTFRKEGTDEILSFNVLPYAELLHHAASGDLQDFRIGERAIFRLHENDKGEWTWLTYIQDEMNMMNGHKEYFHVDNIDAPNGKLTCAWANADKSFIRDKSVTLCTDKDTRFWKKGEPAQFSDIKPGDKLRTKTHGVGKGVVRMAWEVFLDDESMLKFQSEQRAVHAKRMQEEGLPGYVDASADGTLQLTLFREGGEWASKLRAGQKIRIAPAGADRKPSAEPVSGTLTEIKAMTAKVSIDAQANNAFKPTQIFRLWPGEIPK